MPTDLEKFINAKARFRGNFTLEDLIFNQNLQELSNRLTILAGLHTNGKLSTTQVRAELLSLMERFNLPQ